MFEDDFELDEPLTFEMVADIVGARRSLVVRLAQQGLIDTVDDESGEQFLPRRTVIRLRRMQRLRRDLGVNFAGAAVILDLVNRLNEMNRELARLHQLVK
jgi:chaperone modulatory protein CbpM